MLWQNWFYWCVHCLLGDACTSYFLSFRFLPTSAAVGTPILNCCQSSGWKLCNQLNNWYSGVSRVRMEKNVTNKPFLTCSLQSIILNSKNLLNSIVYYFWNQMWSWFALFCAWIGVSGQVLDSNGRAVKNASITIDSNLGIFTAADNGYFYIPLTQGPHTLHIKAEGEYKCYTNIVNTNQLLT